MTIVVFLKSLETLEQLCQGTLDECISCPNDSDYMLVRLSFCPCHKSIRYGICEDCRDTATSEKLIEDEMRLAHLQGQRDTPEEFQVLIDEALRQDWW